MNYNILKYVVTVAKEKKFTKAAEKLYISQPSLSQIIKKEEERLSFKLFDRTCTPLELTEAGKEYVLWAEQIISLFENMEKSLKDFSDDDSFTLKVGIMPEFSSFILANPLKNFREKNPNSFVQIKELSNSDLQLGLENSEFDFIIGLTHKDRYLFVNEKLYDERIVLAVTPEFAPERINSSKIDLKDFSEVPFIVMEKGQFLYNVTYDLCRKNGFVPKSVVECYNLETAMHMVKAGVGVSIIPDLMTYIVGDIEYFTIKGIVPQSQISIVYQRDKYLPKKAKELISYIKNDVKIFNNIKVKGKNKI